MAKENVRQELKSIIRAFKELAKETMYHPIGSLSRYDYEVHVIQYRKHKGELIGKGTEAIM